MKGFNVAIFTVSTLLYCHEVAVTGQKSKPGRISSAKKGTRVYSRCNGVVLNSNVARDWLDTKGKEFLRKRISTFDKLTYDDRGDILSLAMIKFLEFATGDVKVNDFERYACTVAKSVVFDFIRSRSRRKEKPFTEFDGTLLSGEEIEWPDHNDPFNPINTEMLVASANLNQNQKQLLNERLDGNYTGQNRNNAQKRKFQIREKLIKAGLFGDYHGN